MVSRDASGALWQRSAGALRLTGSLLGGLVMLDVILGRASRRCDGVSRRDFLRVGALGGLGLTLPALLHSEAHADEKATGRGCGPSR